MHGRYSLFSCTCAYPSPPRRCLGLECALGHARGLGGGLGGNTGGATSIVGHETVLNRMSADASGGGTVRPRAAWPNDTFLSARNIRLACDASLRRLKTDYLDLYQMHHVDRATPWDEIWQAMDTLRQQGKIIYVGSSNFAGWDIAAASEIAKASAVTVRSCSRAAPSVVP